MGLYQRRGGKDRRRRRIRQAYCQTKAKLPDIHPDRIGFGELMDILGKVNASLCPGPHRQQNHALSHSPRCTSFSRTWLNICVFHGYHPSAWKRACALMAHTPSKRRSDPCSYWPISLLCCLSEVFEAIMTKRLMSWAENTDKLPTEQSGFRKHHSTNDKVIELTQAVSQAHRLSRRHISRYRKGIQQSLAERLTFRTVTHERPRFAAQMDFQLTKG